jgi:Flp pilus assembly secretin CpaC
VVVAQVRRGLMRCLVPHFLKGSGQKGAGGQGHSHLFFGVLDSPGDSRDFLTLLQGLRDENLAKLLAEPRLITLSGQPASFLSGGEQAIPTPAGNSQVGVQFEEFGTRLNFLPTVLEGGKIHLELEIEVSQLDAASGANISGAFVPGRTTHRVHTSVEVADGQTFVMGGQESRKETVKVEAIPVLGQLPVVGPLFCAKGHDPEVVEQVVLITASLVRPTSGGQSVEACPVPRSLPPSLKTPGQANSACPRQDAEERLQRLQRRMQRLQEEMDDLRRELRLLQPGGPETHGEADFCR